VAIVIGATYALQTIKPEWYLIGAPLASGYLAANIAYTLVAAFAGGFVTVRIAARAPLKHAYALAAVSVAMTVLAALTGEQEQPRWFQALRAVVMVAAIVAAGRMRKSPSVQTESQQNVSGNSAARGIAGDGK
jgi:peptidoglycan/LPS O-acetylase OafA/YrhL